MLLKIALLLSIISGTALAADSNGYYMVGGGTGSVPCSEFAKALETANAHGYGTIEYVTDMQGYSMYLFGFQSGYNKGASNTYDIFSGIEEKELMSWLSNYCKENPKTRFGVAVSMFAETNYSARSREYVP
jgi:hypothetical protein